MIGKFILGAVALAVVVLGVVTAPDLARYMKIRSM